MMIPSENAQMELGNLVFGNSRGAFQIPREQYTPLFQAFTTELDRRVLDAMVDGYENDVFLVRPYYWGDDEAEMAKPNFLHKPSGTEISWYKYPLRDAYCSKNLDTDDFRIMLYDCLDSLPPEQTLVDYLMRLRDAGKSTEIRVCRNDGTKVYYRGTPKSVLEELGEHDRFRKAPVMYNPDGSDITADGRITVWMEPDVTATVMAMGMDKQKYRDALRNISPWYGGIGGTPKPEPGAFEAMEGFDFASMYPSTKREDTSNGN